MKIAVCGSGSGENKEILNKVKGLGKEIIKSGNILLTGGCSGYPYAAVRGAILENGKVVCYSPAKNKEEHIERYGFPFEENAEYIFTGAGIPGRNLNLIENSDAVIIVDGQIGTLNEFTIAFVKNKKIAVLEGSGKLIELIPKISEVCSKHGEGKNIIYNSNINQLIKELIEC